MEAGSGGIRWNSTNNQIQVMDTNKNWIDWRYYDPYIEFQFIMNVYNGSTLNYTFEKTGIYILVSSNVTWNSLAISSPYNQLLYLNSANTIHAIWGEIDKKITATYSTQYNGSFSLAYFGGQYQNFELIRYARSANDGSTQTIEFVNQRNRIYVASMGSIQSGSMFARINNTTSTKQASDSKRYAFISTIGQEASGSISVYGPASQGSSGVVAEIAVS